ncbi:MAG: GHKL domain-containing protein [Lachnospiraceae bacterium]|nr:GHKL domain-containing protein [Lachnospiraceae bacterium]
MVFFIILSWILMLWILKPFLKKIKIRKKNFESILISGIGMVSAVFVLNQILKVCMPSISDISFWIFVILVLLFWGSYSFIKKKEEQARCELSERNYQLLDKKYSHVQGIYTQNARLYHDINNHLNVLYQLALNNDSAGIQQYIEDISDPIRKSEDFILTGIDVIDIILNSKFAKMKEAGIKYDVNIDFLPNCQIPSKDMSAILCNLLDNAIEAVLKIESNGPIQLTMQKIQKFLVIKVKNPCSENITVTGKFPETTKENPLFHGWGMLNIDSAARKNGGMLKYKIEKNQFITEVLLFYKEKPVK